VFKSPIVQFAVTAGVLWVCAALVLQSPQKAEVLFYSACIIFGAIVLMAFFGYVSKKGTEPKRDDSEDEDNPPATLREKIFDEWLRRCRARGRGPLDDDG
jgi:hypothetical protein